MKRDGIRIGSSEKTLKDCCFIIITPPPSILRSFPKRADAAAAALGMLLPLCQLPLLLLLS